MNYQETFRALAAVTAPSGFESPILDVIEELCRPHDVEMRRDALGSLIVHRPGAGQRVMLITHADTFGMIVTFRDEKGFFRFGLLGKAEPSWLIGLPVRFTNGARGVVGCEGGVEPAKLALRHLYIDVTVGDVRVGDACAPALITSADENRFVSPALDGRAGCLAALDVLSRAKGTDADLTIVFSVQHAVGERGAAAAAFSAEPEIALSLELTSSGDTPESRVRSGIRLGGGPALVIRADGAPSNMALLESLEAKAEFPVQRTVDPDGQFALDPLSSVRAGIVSCGIGIPARRYGLMAAASPADMRQAADLILAQLRCTQSATRDV